MKEEIEVAYKTMELVNGIKYLWHNQFLHILTTVNRYFEIDTIEDFEVMIKGVKRGIESYFYYDEPSRGCNTNDEFFRNLSAKDFSISTWVPKKETTISWNFESIPEGLMFHIGNRTTTTP